MKRYDIEFRCDDCFMAENAKGRYVAYEDVKPLIEAARRLTYGVGWHNEPEEITELAKAVQALDEKGAGTGQDHE